MQLNMIFCHGCGAKINSMASSCPHCGALQHKLVQPAQAAAVVDNGVVWILAFAPLLGYVLEYVFAFAINDSNWQAELAMQKGSYWFVTLILNVSLSILDQKRLENYGFDVSKFKGFVWLIPVYLYQRAKAFNHNFAYFITWIFCFFLVALS